ncbi:MAG: hypothetical protein L3J56_07510, partial [Bacteroidales bacterium]|nr:hypothetical protein [Bacteroidales bacterium]
YIMTFILLLSVIGITVNKHYSGNKLFSFSVFTEAESCCTGHCNCCNNTSETYKLTDSFLKTDFESNPKPDIVNPFGYILSTNEIIPFLSENLVFSSTYSNTEYIVNTLPAYLQNFRL